VPLQDTFRRHVPPQDTFRRHVPLKTPFKLHLPIERFCIVMSISACFRLQFVLQSTPIFPKCLMFQSQTIMHEPLNTQDDLVNSATAAAILRCARQSLTNLIRRGELNAIPLERGSRTWHAFRREDVEALAERRGPVLTTPTTKDSDP
jgi:hypothetical protein